MYGTGGKHAQAARGEQREIAAADQDRERCRDSDLDPPLGITIHDQVEELGGEAPDAVFHRRERLDCSGAEAEDQVRGRRGAGKQPGLVSAPLQVPGLAGVRRDINIDRRALLQVSRGRPPDGMVAEEPDQDSNRVGFTLPSFPHPAWQMHEACP